MIVPSNLILIMAIAQPSYAIAAIPPDIMIDETIAASHVSQTSQYCVRNQCVEIDDIALEHENLLRFRLQGSSRFLSVPLPPDLGDNVSIDIRYSVPQGHFIARILHGPIRAGCAVGNDRDFVTMDLRFRPQIEDRQYVNCAFVDR